MLPFIPLVFVKCDHIYYSAPLSYLGSADIGFCQKFLLTLIYTHFEEGGLLSENRNGTEIRDESDNNSTITPLISAAKMYKMSPVDESDNENVYKLMLEEIFDRIQYQPSLNRR